MTLSSLLSPPSPRSAALLASRWMSSPGSPRKEASPYWPPPPPPPGIPSVPRPISPNRSPIQSPNPSPLQSSNLPLFSPPPAPPYSPSLPHVSREPSTKSTQNLESPRPHEISTTSRPESSPYGSPSPPFSRTLLSPAPQWLKSLQSPWFPETVQFPPTTPSPWPPSLSPRPSPWFPEAAPYPPTEPSPSPQRSPLSPTYRASPVKPLSGQPGNRRSFPSRRHSPSLSSSPIKSHPSSPLSPVSLQSPKFLRSPVITWSQPLSPPSPPVPRWCSPLSPSSSSPLPTSLQFSSTPSPEEKSSSEGGGSSDPPPSSTTSTSTSTSTSTPTPSASASSASSPPPRGGYVNEGYVCESPARRKLSPAPGAGAGLEVPGGGGGGDPPRRKSILHVTDHPYDGVRAATTSEASAPARRVSILQNPLHPQHGEDGEHHHHRKVSSALQQEGDGLAHYEAPDVPSRRKSILSQGSHYSSHRDESEAPSRKVSILHAPDYASSPGHGSYAQHADEGAARSRAQQLHGSDSDLASHHSCHSHRSQPSSRHSIENGKAGAGGAGGGGDALPMKKFGADAFADKFKYHDPDKSWLFLFCAKCRQQPSGEAWEPPGWQRACPHPFCPSYRQCARLLALALVGLLAWGVVFCVVGRAAAPGGQLFGLAALALAAHLGGWLVSLTTLPPLVGMLLVGILMQNVGLVAIADDYIHVVSVLRKVALVIILTRAGLDLDPAAMSRLRVAVLKLSLVPWAVECAAVAASAHFLLGLPWMWGVLLGSVVAAVSPAVVVSCLIRLRAKGYGVAKGIPTLIIAISGIDDAISVAGFGIIQSLMFSSESLAYQIAQGPLSILGGLAFGGLWGLLAKFVPEKNDPFAVPLRILLLFGGGLAAVFGSEELGFGGAGPLGAVAAAFVACYHWSQQGWEVEDNPVATAFEVFWMIFEPILFSLTGTQIRFDELAGDTVSVAFACLAIGIVIRIVVTVVVAIGSKLNLKEKIFVALAWMSKATVQAALGPVALDIVRPENNPEKTGYAEKTLVVCVLSILLTAPVGAIMMTILGPRLLKKTTMPPIVEGWRRSARPSLRDITIIDEEEDGDGVAT